jgi:1-acyl-sn-glycerol-3-phosphate acyltransferase
MFWIRIGAFVFYRVRVYGRKNVPRAGAFVLAANHRSNLDPPIIASFGSPRVIHFMAKDELFSKPILSWLLPVLHAFPVNREGSARATLRVALDKLRGGIPVAIFPEGRRKREGSGEVRLGGAWLATQGQVPVVPCAIEGSAGARLFRSQIKVAYGIPIPPPAEKATRDELEKFTETIMGAIFALSESIGGNS